MLQLWTTNLSFSNVDPELGIYKLGIPSEMKSVQLFFEDMFNRRDRFFSAKGCFEQDYERRTVGEGEIIYTFK